MSGDVTQREADYIPLDDWYISNDTCKAPSEIYKASVYINTASKYVNEDITDIIDVPNDSISHLLYITDNGNNNLTLVSRYNYNYFGVGGFGYQFRDCPLLKCYANLSVDERNQYVDNANKNGAITTSHKHILDTVKSRLHEPKDSDFEESVFLNNLLSYSTYEEKHSIVISYLDFSGRCSFNLCYTLISSGHRPTLLVTPSISLFSRSAEIRNYYCIDDAVCHIGKTMAVLSPIESISFINVLCHLSHSTRSNDTLAFILHNKDWMKTLIYSDSQEPNLLPEVDDAISRINHIYKQLIGLYNNSMLAMTGLEKLAYNYFSTIFNHKKIRDDNDYIYNTTQFFKLNVHYLTRLEYLPFKRLYNQMLYMNNSIDGNLELHTYKCDNPCWISPRVVIFQNNDRLLFTKKEQISKFIFIISDLLNYIGLSKSLIDKFQSCSMFIVKIFKSAITSVITLFRRVFLYAFSKLVLLVKGIFKWSNKAS